MSLLTGRSNEAPSQWYWWLEMHCWERGTWKNPATTPSAPLLTPKLWQQLFAEVIRTWKSRMMSGFPHSFAGNGRVGVGVGVWRIEQGNHSLHVTVAACKISIMLGFSFFVPLQEREGLCWNMGDTYPSIFLSLVSTVWTSMMKRIPGNLGYPHSCCQVMHKARASPPVLNKAATAE